MPSYAVLIVVLFIPEAFCTWQVEGLLLQQCCQDAFYRLRHSGE